MSKVHLPQFQWHSPYLAVHLLHYSEVFHCCLVLQSIIYRDIKPENLLVDEQGRVKLCDFGECVECYFFCLCKCITKCAEHDLL